MNILKKNSMWIKNHMKLFIKWLLELITLKKYKLKQKRNGNKIISQPKYTDNE